MTTVPKGTSARPASARRSSCSHQPVPIYYREGSFKAIALFYWSRKGQPGLHGRRFPFYWHYYSPTTDALRRGAVLLALRPTAPRLRLKVVLNVSWSSEPGARSFAIWPLFYASNKFGWAIPFLADVQRRRPEDRQPVRRVRWASTGGSAPRRARSTSASCRPTSRRATPRHAFTWVAPLNFYWRNADDRNLLALPLFYKNDHKTGNSVYTWLGYSSAKGWSRAGRRSGSTGTARTTPTSPATTSYFRCSGASAPASRGAPCSSRCSGASARRSRAPPSSFRCTSATTAAARTSGRCFRCGGAAATSTPGAASSCCSRSSSGRRTRRRVPRRWSPCPTASPAIAPPAPSAASSCRC